MKELHLIHMHTAHTHIHIHRDNRYSRHTEIKNQEERIYRTPRERKREMAREKERKKMKSMKYQHIYTETDWN